MDDDESVTIGAQVHPGSIQIDDALKEAIKVINQRSSATNETTVSQKFKKINYAVCGSPSHLYSSSYAKKETQKENNMENMDEVKSDHPSSESLFTLSTLSTLFSDGAIPDGKA